MAAPAPRPASRPPQAPRPQPVRPWLRRLVLALPLLIGLLHWSGTWRLGFIDTLDHLLDDTRQRALLHEGTDPRIAIVQIDDRSLAEIGRWPWGRDRLAELTRALFDHNGAAVVGFNMVFAEPDPSENLRLLRQLADGPLHDDTRFLTEFWRLRPALDHDANFAQALTGRRAVLGFYLANTVGARPIGQPPQPLFASETATGLPRFTGFGANLEGLAEAAPRAGYFNVLPDDDGIVRAVPLLAESVATDGSRSVHPAFALALLRALLGDPAVEAVRPTGAAALLGRRAGISAVRLRQGERSLDIPLDERGTARIPFQHPGRFTAISAADVLKGRLPPGALAGKAVIVGTTALGLADLRPTPIGSATPGVAIHASLLAGLLDGGLPTRPDWARGFELTSLLVGCLLLAWGLSRLSAAWALGAAAFSLAVWLGINVWLYQQQNWVLPLALPLLASLATATLAIADGYLAEGRSRRALARLFGAYVPPELVTRMAHDPERYTRAGLGAENRELTMLFCDLHDFTHTAERLSPEQLREVVNLFFSRMAHIIGEHGGTLDKFIGDAVMAFWGAPVETDDHAVRAVRAALDMLEGLESVNAELRQRGLPELRMGIGINTGLVCVGELGSDARRSYTVIGDAVNLASRVEDLTRSLGVDVLVGETTYRTARDAAPELPWRMVGLVPVKGRAEPVMVFTPLAPLAQQAVTPA